MSNNERVRTLYNPGVGMRYNITNVDTGEVIVASTLTVRDVDQKPWRSPKGTENGKEFFKMKIGTKRDGFTYIKFINSIKNEKCLSEDGVWEFNGVRPDGSALPLLSISERDIVIKSKKDRKVSLKEKPKQPKTEAPTEVSKPVVLTEKEFKSEYCNEDFLNTLLEDK